MSLRENSRPVQHHSVMILADAQFRYYPLWEVRRNEVFCYICEAFWEAGGDYPLVEDELAAEFEDPGRILSLDMEILHKALAQAEEVAAQYGVMKVLIPVHYETLVHLKSSDAYVQECNRLVWPVFDDVYFEIIKPPSSISQESLAQAAGVVDPFGQGVMLRVEPGFDQFDIIPSDLFLSVGMDLRVDPRQEKDIISELDEFSRKAKQYGLQAHVHGLESVTLSAAAISAGFDFIGSDAIAEHLEKEEQGAANPQPDKFLKIMLASRQSY